MSELMQLFSETGGRVGRDKIFQTQIKICALSPPYLPSNGLTFQILCLLRGGGGGQVGNVYTLINLDGKRVV